MIDFMVKAWGKRPYVNTWDSQYPLIVKTLLENKYQVCIIDQVGRKQDNDLADRELTQVITQGTFSDFENPDYNPRYLMSLVHSPSDNSFGICALEATTHQIYLDEFVDDKLFSNLRTILKKLKPSEVVFDKQNVEGPIQSMIKQVCNPYVSKVDHEFEEVKDILQSVQEKFKKEGKELPVLVQEIVDMYEDNNQEYREKLEKKKEEKEKQGKMEEE